MGRKLNVLQFICSSGFYGAEMWILALAKNLDKKQVNCSLAITRESDQQNMEIYERFKGLGLTACQLPLKGRFDPRAIFRLCDRIQKEKIDLIHTHGYKSDILGLIAARITGIRSLATPHGFENIQDIKLQTYIRLGCFALRFFDRVAPLSSELASDMRRIGVALSKIHQITNGVDLQEARAESQHVAPPLYPGPEKKIGYVGQLAYRKNLADLIQTFDLLYGDRQDIRLLLVGDGPKRLELEALAGSLASADKIAFLGYREDRLRIVKELDIFCMTSSLEGIPRCMMEAMAMKVPVAAFDIAGVRDLIDHERTGLMAEFGDREGLKQCWQRLLSDKGFAQKMAENGHRHVMQHYSAQRMADEYLRLYRQMIRD